MWCGQRQAPAAWSPPCPPAWASTSAWRAAQVTLGSSASRPQHGCLLSPTSRLCFSCSLLESVPSSLFPPLPVEALLDSLGVLFTSGQSRQPLGHASGQGGSPGEGVQSGAGAFSCPTPLARPGGRLLHAQLPMHRAAGQQLSGSRPAALCGSLL